MNAERDLALEIDGFIDRVSRSLREWKLVEIRRRVAPSNFGNAEIIFTNPYISLRVLRDRFQFSLELGPRSVREQGDWFGADVVLAYLAQRCGEQLVLPMPALDVLSKLSESYYDIQRLFEEREFATQSRAALTKFRRSLRPEFEARTIRTKPD